MNARMCVRACVCLSKNTIKTHSLEHIICLLPIDSWFQKTKEIQILNSNEISYKTWKIIFTCTSTYSTTMLGSD